MAMLTKSETDALTGKTVMVELTADELEQRDKDAVEYAAKDVVTAQAATDKSALLTKLGLTADEFKTLLGGN